jgi:threonine synthase
MRIQEQETPSAPTTAGPQILGSAWFTCFAGCEERYPLDEVRYRCARCGGLLDVRHDLDALRGRFPAASAWQRLFAERAELGGVWSKREWVCPAIEDEDIVSLLEGNTPLLPMPTLARALDLPPLYIKQCGQSHTGSFKDLGMTVLVSMVNHMRRRGRQIPAIACASTGDTSAALAAYAARAGIPALVFLPEGKISDEQLMQPIANFARTVALRTDFDGCMALVAEFCQKHGVYLANSMNPLRIEGQKTVSIEICQQLTRAGAPLMPPAWVVVPGGNLGNVTAIGKGFEMLRALGLIDRLPRLAVAQAAHASPLYQAYRDGWRYAQVTARATQASAIQIGAPVNVHKAIATLRRFDGVVEIADEDEIAHACMIGDRHGLYTDPHTGVALSVAAKLARAGTLSGTGPVVVVSTAHGLKFSAPKRAYHLGTGRTGPLCEVTPRAPNPPVTLPADLRAAEEALLPFLDVR